MVMIFGYWDIRGLAHAIRLLLEYTDSHYEEKKYTMGDGNGILMSSDLCPTPPDVPSHPCPGHLLLPLATLPLLEQGLPSLVPLWVQLGLPRQEGGGGAGAPVSVIGWVPLGLI
uniref:GST N-terminal domain-containing protein n=1 Tax=Suricata suricatta TaxID=37032 RepID=A0A673VVD0_SURSU